jgi:hypothetical protein
MARSIAGGAWGERDGDHLPAFAGDDQGPVASFQPQVLDAGPSGFRYPQPVEPEQGDQRMPSWRSQPGGDEKRAELVAVSGSGVRLVVQPGTADVRGRRVLEQFFLDGVRPRASSSRANVSMSARRTENSGRDRARHRPVNCRRSSVFASRYGRGTRPGTRRARAAPNQCTPAGDERCPKRTPHLQDGLYLRSVDRARPRPRACATRYRRSYCYQAFGGASPSAQAW